MRSDILPLVLHICRLQRLCAYTQSPLAARYPGSCSNASAADLRRAVSPRGDLRVGEVRLCIFRWEHLPAVAFYEYLTSSVATGTHKTLWIGTLVAPGVPYRLGLLLFVFCISIFRPGYVQIH